MWLYRLLFGNQHSFAAFRRSPPRLFRKRFGSEDESIALASAIGTFLAAVAALMSVYVIVFDEDPPVIWNIGIGLWWMLGVLLQLAAGTAARLGQFRGATG